MILLPSGDFHCIQVRELNHYRKIGQNGSIVFTCLKKGMRHLKEVQDLCHITVIHTCEHIKMGNGSVTSYCEMSQFILFPLIAYAYNWRIPKGFYYTCNIVQWGKNRLCGRCCIQCSPISKSEKIQTDKSAFVGRFVYNMITTIRVTIISWYIVDEKAFLILSIWWKWPLLESIQAATFFSYWCKQTIDISLYQTILSAALMYRSNKNLCVEIEKLQHFDLWNCF